MVTNYAMLIYLLMKDAELRRIPDKKRYVKNQLAAIFGAVAMAFCLFDGNSGAKFESLTYSWTRLIHCQPYECFMQKKLPTRCFATISRRQMILLRLSMSGKKLYVI